MTHDVDSRVEISPNGKKANAMILMMFQPFYVNHSFTFDNKMEDLNDDALASEQTPAEDAAPINESLIGIAPSVGATDFKAAIAGTFKAPSSDDWLRSMEVEMLARAEGLPSVVGSASRAGLGESDLTRSPSGASRSSQRVLLTSASKKSAAAELSEGSDELAHLMARFERAAAVIRANELKHLVPMERARARKTALMHGEWRQGVHERVEGAVRGRVTRALCKQHGLQDPGAAVAVALGARGDSSSREAGGITKLELDLADPARQLLTRREREVRSVGHTSYVADLRRMGALVSPDGRYEMLSPLGLTEPPVPLGVLMARTAGPSAGPIASGKSDARRADGSARGAPHAAAAAPWLTSSRSASGLLLPAASPLQGGPHGGARPAGGTASSGMPQTMRRSPGHGDVVPPLASYHDGHLAFIQRAAAAGVPLSRVALPPDSKFTASDALRHLEGGSDSRHLRATLTRMEREAMAAGAAGASGKVAGGRDTGDAITQLGLPKDLLSSDGNTRPTLHPATWGAHLIEATTYAHPWPLVGDGVLGPKHPTVRAFADSASAVCIGNRQRCVGRYGSESHSL